MQPTAPRALSWRAVIGALIRGETLSPDEAAWAMNEILEGAATPVQVAGFGVVIDLSPAASAQLVEETGIAFLFAPLYHPALRHASVARSQLGVPTVFN